MPSSAHHLRGRTGPMLAMGILNMIGGVCAAAAGAMMLVVGAMARQNLSDTRALFADLPPDAKRDELLLASSRVESMMSMMPAMAIFWLLVGVLLVVGSIGFVRMRPWGRSLTLAMCWVLIAATIILIPLRLGLGVKMTDAIDLSLFPYWVLSISLLMSRGWRAAFIAAPSESRSVDPW